MKSKVTSILMFFIIVGIVGLASLLGIIIFKDIFDSKTLEPATELEDGEVWYTTEDELIDSQTGSTSTRKTLETLEIPQTPKTKIKNSSGSNTEDVSINYDNITVNKYFYNQLNKYSQTMYKAFESNKEQMKTGRHQVNFGTTFTDVLSGSNGQEKLGEYFQSAVEAYIYDNPDVFYLNPSKMYLNIETITRGNKKSYNVYINNRETTNYLIDEFNSKEEINNALSKIESVRNSLLSRKTNNTYQNIKMVHDYLVDNISYDSSLTGENIYNLCGALVNNKCVCEGYAKAFKYLLDGMGIECTLVIGKGTNSSGKSENHAWNYVKLDGNYYAVDATWDDPIVIGGSATQSMKTKYFLKGQKEMSKDHFPSGKFTEEGQEFNYPPLSYTSYNY